MFVDEEEIFPLLEVDLKAETAISVKEKAKKEALDLQKSGGNKYDLHGNGDKTLCPMTVKIKRRVRSLLLNSLSFPMFGSNRVNPIRKITGANGLNRGPI